MTVTIEIPVAIAIADILLLAISFLVGTVFGMAFAIKKFGGKE